MDPISDFLIQVKNAGLAGKPQASVPFSNLKHEIAKFLEKEGYIGFVSIKGKKATRRLEVGIVYRGKLPRIEDVKRMSKPSRRLYAGAKEILPVKQGTGMLVLSTPKGIVRGETARKENIGGEMLFKIW